MNELMEIPWFLIIGMLSIFSGVFYLTRKELLKRNEEHEIGFLLEECSTKNNFEVSAEGYIWWRIPQGGDSYQTYRQWGENKVGKRVQAEVEAWLMEAVGKMDLGEVKAKIAEIARSQEGLSLDGVPVHPRIRILVREVNLKDADARSLANKATQGLRAEGVKSAMEILKGAGLTPGQAANVLTTLQAVETSGGQLASVMAKLTEIVEVTNE